MSNSSAHHGWLEALASDAIREYKSTREQLTGPSNAQQRGHSYEAIFRRVLLGWLPPHYGIGTRKYLVFERPVRRKTNSAETDLVIFHPAYPRELRERSEVLLSGVVAAFSVKSELTTAALKQAIAEARSVREGFAARPDSEIGELVSPLIFGVLAHSYNPRVKDPSATITNALLKEVKSRGHPRGQLDLVCVANLDCWSRTAQVTAHEVETRQPSPNDVYIDFWRSAYQLPQYRSGVSNTSNAVATLIAQLWAKLALRDPQLSHIARGLELTKTGVHPGPGHPRPLDGLASNYVRKRLFEDKTVRTFA